MIRERDTEMSSKTMLWKVIELKIVSKNDSSTKKYSRDKHHSFSALGASVLTI